MMVDGVLYDCMLQQVVGDHTTLASSRLQVLNFPVQSNSTLILSLPLLLRACILRTCPLQFFSVPHDSFAAYANRVKYSSVVFLSLCSFGLTRSSSIVLLSASISSNLHATLHCTDLALAFQYVRYLLQPPVIMQLTLRHMFSSLVHDQLPHSAFAC